CGLTVPVSSPGRPRVRVDDPASPAGVRPFGFLAGCSGVNRQEVASLANGHRTAARPCLQDGVRRTAAAGPTFMPPGFAVVLGSVSASEPPGKLPDWCPAWAAPGAGWCGGRWALEQPAGAPHWGSIWGAF